MEALYAIAMLCAVSVGTPFSSLKKVDAYQLRCQQEYVKCYEEKMKEPPVDNNDPKVWVGKLKSCVAERKVK